jgi:hypothetical protein
MSGLLLLEAGCWSSYLVDSQLLAEAKQLEQSPANSGRIVAISAVAHPIDPPGARVATQPDTYVRAAGLHVELDVPGAKYKVVSARRHRAFRIGGGIVLGIGLASLIGGAIGAASIGTAPCPRYEPQDDCGLGNAIGALLVGVPAGVFGLIETVVGGTLLGLGANRNQLGPNEPYTVYLPPSGSPEPHAPSTPALRWP